MTTFRAFLLYKYPPKSFRCLQSYEVEAPDKEPIKYLKQTALEHIKQTVLESIKSPSSLQEWELLGVAGPEIYSVRWLCDARAAQISSRVLQCVEEVQGRSLPQKQKWVADAANRGDLDSESFPLLFENDTFEEIVYRDLIIVFGESLRSHVSRSAE